MRLGWAGLGDTGISIKQFGGGGSKRSTGTMPGETQYLRWLVAFQTILMRRIPAFELARCARHGETIRTGKQMTSRKVRVS
jgi:hypothetical protein